jgi:hypothetical protein
MIASIDIDHVDESELYGAHVVRRLGRWYLALLPFLKQSCVAQVVAGALTGSSVAADFHPSWLRAAPAPHLSVDVIKNGLVDENQKVKTITVPALAAMA